MYFLLTSVLRQKRQTSNCMTIFFLSCPFKSLSNKQEVLICKPSFVHFLPERCWTEARINFQKVGRQSSKLCDLAKNGWDMIHGYSKHMNSFKWHDELLHAWAKLLVSFHGKLITCNPRSKSWSNMPSACHL